MESLYNVQKTARKKSGAVEIEYDYETGAFLTAVIHAIPDFGVLLTLDWPQTWGLYKVCDYVFERPEEFKVKGTQSHLWAKTGFHYIAPTCDRKDLFWLSFGPLNCWVPTNRMKVVYEDLKAALDLCGGPGQFMTERQESTPYRVEAQ